MILNRIALFLLILTSAPVHAEVWMVKEGKHVNLVFDRDVAAEHLPVELPAGEYVMISWGDAAYYTTERKSLKKTFRALFLPTQAAVNLRVFNDLSEVPQTKSRAKLYMFATDPEDERDMLARVSRAIVRDSQVTPLGENDWVGGEFYVAHDKRYSLLYTCNNWVAAVLKAGGLPFSEWTTQLAPALVVQHKVAWLAKSTHRERSDYRSLRVSAVQ